MWSDPATIIALCTGVSGIIAAVTALVKLFRHEGDPQAHAAGTAAPPPGTP